MLAPIFHIQPLTTIRRTRTLAMPARVGVRVGQKVNASDIVAQATLPSKHLFIDLRRGLGIPIAAVEQHLVRHEGDMLIKGDVIAEVSGLFSRIVRSPVDGQLMAIRAGQALIQVQSSTISLKAGYSGIVTDIIPEHGVIIESTGAVLQGVWGNGQSDNGLLVIPSTIANVPLTRGGLDVALRGAVVLAGYCDSEDALIAAAELPLRGLILAGMSSALLPIAAKQAFPIIVMQGFGNLPLSEQAMRLLTSSEKRELSIQAYTDIGMNEYPEVVIPLPSQAPPAMESAYFAPNQQVRIAGMPYNGKIGKILTLRPGMSVLPNGVRTPAADVQIYDDVEPRRLIPLANLSVME